MLESRTHNKKVIEITIVLIVCITALSLISPALSKKPSWVVEKVANDEVTESSGIEIYWDAKGTNPVYSIEWGSLEPGTDKEVTLYVKNKGKTPVTLSYFVSNWDSPELDNYLHLTWDYTEQVISFKEVLQVVFTLHASEKAEVVENFSFDITILCNL